jgi:hypothetical protein
MAPDRSSRRWLARAACQTLLLVAVFLVRTGLAAGFAPIDDLTRDEDSGAVNVPVEFDASSLPPSAFTFEVDSNNDALLPPGAIMVLGSTPRAIVRLRPAPDAWGEAVIRVRARSLESGVPSYLTTFRLFVLAVDDPPRFGPVPNQVMTEGSAFLRIPIEISDPDSAFQFFADAGNNRWIRAVAETSAGRRFVSLRATETRSDVPVRATINLRGVSGTTASTYQFYVTLLPRDFQPANRLTGLPEWGNLLSGLPPVVGRL